MRKGYKLTTGIDVRFEADNDIAARRIATGIQEKVMDAPERAAAKEVIRRVLPDGYHLEQVGVKKRRILRSAKSEDAWREIAGFLLVGLSGALVYTGITELNFPAFVLGWLILYVRLRREAQERPTGDS